MEKITTKKQLVENLKNALSVEIVARDSYKKDLLIFEDPKIKKAILEIELDEEKHIEYIKELIDAL